MNDSSRWWEILIKKEKTTRIFSIIINYFLLSTGVLSRYWKFSINKLLLSVDSHIFLMHSELQIVKKIFFCYYEIHSKVAYSIVPYQLYFPSIRFIDENGNCNNAPKRRVYLPLTCSICVHLADSCHYVFVTIMVSDFCGNLIPTIWSNMYRIVSFRCYVCE